MGTTTMEQGEGCANTRAHKALDALFLGDLPSREYASLREHLSGCEECREQYERVSRVQAQLEKRTVPEARKELLAHQLLGRLQPHGRRPSPWATWGKLFLPVAAAAAVVTLVVPQLVNPPRDEFAPRAGAAETSHGVRAFCVAPGATARVLGEARPGQTLRCPESASVQFTYTSPSATELEVFTVQAGERQSFFSSAPGKIALGAAVDQPLPVSTPLSALGQGEHAVSTTFRDPASGETVEVPGPTLRVVAE